MAILLLNCENFVDLEFGIHIFLFIKMLQLQKLLTYLKCRKSNSNSNMSCTDAFFLVNVGGARIKTVFI